MSSISSMEREIARCEAEIAKNKEEIKALEKRNEELREIKKKFEETHEKLYDYNKRRNNTYICFLILFLLSCIVVSVCSSKC